MLKKTRLKALLLACVFASFCCGMGSTAFGEDAQQKTKVDPRDKYLSIEALCGYEGMPYEFMISEEEYVKTKTDPNDIYLDMEALCSEDPPFKYVVIPGKHIKTKTDPRDMKIGAEEMLSEDPSFLRVKE